MRNQVRITNAELALLSLLAEKPMHAYQIEQIIEKRGMRDWTSIGFSSIYYLLKKMYKAGWLTKKQKESEIGGAKKQVYEFSKKGKIVWENAIINLLQHAYSGDNPFLIGISVISQLRSDIVSHALSNHLYELEKISKSLREKVGKNDETTPLHVLAMFDYSLNQINASIMWIKKWKNIFGQTD